MKAVAKAAIHRRVYDAGTVRLRGETLNSLELDVRAFVAEHITPASEYLSPEQSWERFCSWLQRQSPRRWLLVVDNADDKGVCQKIYQLWQAAGRGDILVSTRLGRDYLERECRGASFMQVDVLDDDEAAQLLWLTVCDHDTSTNSERPQVGGGMDALAPQERDALHQVAKGSPHGCGGLPLALVAAGKMMSGYRDGGTWSGFLVACGTNRALVKPALHGMATHSAQRHELNKSAKKYFLSTCHLEGDEAWHRLLRLLPEPHARRNAFLRLSDVPTTEVTRIANACKLTHRVLADLIRAVKVAGADYDTESQLDRVSRQSLAHMWRRPPFKLENDARQLLGVLAHLPPRKIDKETFVWGDPPARGQRVAALHATLRRPHDLEANAPACCSVPVRRDNVAGLVGPLLDASLLRQHDYRDPTSVSMHVVLRAVVQLLHPLAQAKVGSLLDSFVNGTALSAADVDCGCAGIHRFSVAEQRRAEAEQLGWTPGVAMRVAADADAGATPQSRRTPAMCTVL